MYMCMPSVPCRVDAIAYNNKSLLCSSRHKLKHAMHMYIYIHICMHVPVPAEYSVCLIIYMIHVYEYTCMHVRVPEDRFEDR